MVNIQNIVMIVSGIKMKKEDIMKRVLDWMDDNVGKNGDVEISIKYVDNGKHDRRHFDMIIDVDQKMTKGKIDEYLLKRVKSLIKHKDKKIIYSSSKQFINIAVLKLLKKEESDKKW